MTNCAVTQVVLVLVMGKWNSASIAALELNMIRAFIWDAIGIND